MVNDVEFYKLKLTLKIPILLFSLSVKLGIFEKLHSFQVVNLCKVNNLF